MVIRGFVSTSHQTWHHSDFFKLFLSYEELFTFCFSVKNIRAIPENLEGKFSSDKKVPKSQFPSKVCVEGQFYTHKKLCFFSPRQYFRPFILYSQDDVEGYSLSLTLAWKYFEKLNRQHCKHLKLVGHRHEKKKFWPISFQIWEASFSQRSQKRDKWIGYINVRIYSKM